MRQLLGQLMANTDILNKYSLLISGYKRIAVEVKNGKMVFRKINAGCVHSHLYKS